MRSLVVVVGVAVLAVAGCSGDPKSDDAAAAGGTPTQSETPSETPASASSNTPAPVAKPTPALSVPMYQRALTNVEKVLKPSVGRVMNAQTVAAFDAARAQLGTAILLERDELSKITPPSGLVVAHPAVLDAFDSYAGSVNTNLGKAGSTRNGCGAPKSPAVRLYEAKAGVRTAYATLAQAVQTAIGKGVKFGTVSVPAKPAAPAVIGGRGENGDVFQRSGSRGASSLQITNAGSDAVIVVTNSVPKKPQASIYVRGNKTVTLNGIRGDYYVYFKSGSNWDDKVHQFTENCSYSKFDKRLDGSYNWRISLTKTLFGNATTSSTDAF
ncbi:hypothetical protein PWY87_07655 [Kribbella solani]|uniref:hypothetical protein n=1 Tax=Kribbella solani TaxID=236067 RepID=UPI0029B3B243|nr:hypothetical protein [Kribbella solani]MDX2969812.1 hypothetical protein [Kribbella solani]MDX3001537.1 hypothetical protein [Kribbella solani]